MISDKKIKEFREEILANGLSEYPYNYTVFDEYDTWWIAAKVIELAQEGYEITHMNPNVLLDSIHISPDNLYSSTCEERSLF